MSKNVYSCVSFGKESLLGAIFILVWWLVGVNDTLRASAQGKGEQNIFLVLHN